MSVTSRGVTGIANYQHYLWDVSFLEAVHATLGLLNVQTFAPLTSVPPKPSCWSLENTSAALRASARLNVVMQHLCHLLASCQI